MLLRGGRRKGAREGKEDRRETELWGSIGSNM